MDLKQFASALGQISEEKGISPEKVLETIEIALAAAYKKEYGEKGQIVRAKFNSKTGDVRVNGIAVRTSDFNEAGAKEKARVVRMFAHEVAQGHIRLPKAITEHNQWVIALVWEYWKRLDGNLPNGLRPEQAFRPQGLTRVFEERLSHLGIASKEEFLPVLVSTIIFSIDFSALERNRFSIIFIILF